MEGLLLITIPKYLYTSTYFISLYCNGYNNLYLLYNGIIPHFEGFIFIPLFITHYSKSYKLLLSYFF